MGQRAQTIEKGEASVSIQHGEKEKRITESARGTKENGPGVTVKRSAGRRNRITFGSIFLVKGRFNKYSAGEEKKESRKLQQDHSWKGALSSIGGSRWHKKRA